jgi:hypothetical protein
MIKKKPKEYHHSHERLANVLYFYWGSGKVEKVRDSMLNYSLETISFYGATAKDEKITKYLLNTALGLKLAGGEMNRHVNLFSEYTDAVWTLGVKGKMGPGS